MSIFGLFDYNKPHPVGVQKDAPNKKRFFYFFELFFRKISKLILLNLVYIAFCIPIVTIGPATAGLTYVLRDFSIEKPVFLFSDFFEQFKKNFKQSFVISIFNFVIFFLVFLVTKFYYNQATTNIIYYPLCIISLSVGILVTMMNYYIHLLIVTIELNIKNIIRNAFILTILGFKTNLITTFWLVLICGVTFLSFPYSIPIIVFILFSLINFITSFNSYQYIDRYFINKKRDTNQS